MNNDGGVFDHVRALEENGRFEEAFALLSALPDDTRGLPAKIGWHMIRKGDFTQGYPLLHVERDGWRPEFLYSLPKEKQYAAGAPLAGKRIFIAPEGGLGDEMLCARFVEAYIKKGAQIILGASTPLHSIFSRLPLPPAEIRLPKSVKPTEYDYWAPAMSAPMLLGLTQPSESTTMPYLTALPAYEEKWRKEIEEYSQGRLKIGLRWQGKQIPETGRLRVESVPAEVLLALSPLGALFSLQRDSGLEELRPSDPVHDLAMRFESWEDTLAAMAQMDYIVTCCTSIAHAAGAMGLQTAVIAVMNPYYPWLGEEGKTPWYKSVRVFTQPSAGDWKGAVQNAYTWFKHE